VPVRILWGPVQGVHLRAIGRDEVSEAHFRSAADRIDIHVEVPRVEYQKLSDDRLGGPPRSYAASGSCARDKESDLTGR
jgi:hypothetical protein